MATTACVVESLYATTISNKHLCSVPVAKLIICWVATNDVFYSCHITHISVISFQKLKIPVR